MIDATQPVALLMDVETASPVRLAGWSELPPGPAPKERAVIADADGVWVQQRGGPLAHITPDGLTAGRHVSDLLLGAVTGHGAWCAPRPRSQDIAAVPEAPPQQHRTSDNLRLARTDTVTRTVHVDAAVTRILSVRGDLFVEVETGRWHRRSLGTPTRWVLEMDTAWLRLGADQPVPDRLTLTAHAHTAPPDTRGRLGWRGRLPELDQRPETDHAHGHDAAGVSAEDSVVPTPHEHAGGLDWYVGSDRESVLGRGQVYAVAVEPTTRSVRWRVPLGVGAAAATTATESHVWVAVQQPRHVATYSPPTPVGVVRVNVRTGDVESVLDPDAVDVEDHCWSLGAPPVDADDYAEFWRRRFERLDAFWTSPNGEVSPLSDGLSDTNVATVGTWPDTALHVTFAWASRPDARLRRIIPLYDELGQAEEPLYADIHIMEDLDTGRVPARTQPGADYLDM